MPWGILWQRPQQVSAELARRGHTVLYCNTSIELRPSSLVSSRNENRLFMLRKTAEKLSVMNLFTLPFQGRARVLSERFSLLLLNAYLRIFAVKPDVALFYSPQDVFIVNLLKSKKVKIAYDCVDEHLAFPNVVDISKVLTAETQLVVKSDVVTVVSGRLWRKISRINPNCFTIPNAADFVHFNKAMNMRARPAEMKNLKRPVVGFIGAIWDWINIDLICKIATLHPEYSIVLIGPVYYGSSKLAEHSNIIVVGHKQYGSLPEYLSAMDVCLIPFKINELTLASSPIKMYEYLAAGKPVVSTDLPEVRASASELVYIGEDDKDFIEKVEIAIDEKKRIDRETLVARRMMFAQENSWEKRVDTLERLLVRLCGNELALKD
jgi:hypothetical protein